MSTTTHENCKSSSVCSQKASIVSGNHSTYDECTLYDSGFLPRGAPPKGSLPPPFGDLCAPVIWPENNRKINTTKEICATIDSPPLKESWKTVQIEQSFSLKTESSKYFRQTLGGYSTLKYLNVPPILISFS